MLFLWHVAASLPWEVLMHWIGPRSFSIKRPNAEAASSWWKGSFVCMLIYVDWYIKKSWPMKLTAVVWAGTGQEVHSELVFKFRCKLTQLSQSHPSSGMFLKLNIPPPPSPILHISTHPINHEWEFSRSKGEGKCTILPVLASVCVSSESPCTLSLQWGEVTCPVRVYPLLSWLWASSEFMKICHSLKPKRCLMLLTVQLFNQGIFNQNYWNV